MQPRRDELAAFLRSRRERVGPGQVGLPRGARRRTPGLRREEVALLAGVGVTWYTWLEQGRSINASVEVLDAIAATLRLDVVERAHLYQLAELPSTPPVPSPGPDDLGSEVPEILDQLAPLPACVLNERYDVLAWNAPYGVLWRRTVTAPAGRRNVLCQAFLIPSCCSPYRCNREAELADLVATLRGRYARHIGEPEWSEFIDRLSAASEEFAALWRAHDVRAPTTRVKTFRHASAGDMAISVTGFDLSASPDRRMLVYTPADRTSRERLDWALAHPDAPTADHRHHS